MPCLLTLDVTSISRNKLRDATGTAIGKALAKGWKLQILKYYQPHGAFHSWL